VAVKASDPAVRAEMQEILHLAAEPLRPNDNGKSRLARAAGALRLGRRRAYALWYGEERAVIREEEVARLRAERDRLLELRIERLRREIAEAERQLGEARRRANLEAATGLDRALAAGPTEVDYTLICRGAA
jgi:hypothetical protein